MKRLRIIMDYKSEIRPDCMTNYVVGCWDKSIEDAVERAMRNRRTTFVIRPEGLKLRLDQL